MGLDTEHAPAARVVGPSELDVAGQGPGGHRSDLRGEVHPSRTLSATTVRQR